MCIEEKCWVSCGGEISGEIGGKHPSGAKAPLILLALCEG